jgi:hypothetical protein
MLERNPPNAAKEKKRNCKIHLVVLRNREYQRRKEHEECFERIMSATTVESRANGKKEGIGQP